jgi:signal peptidase I
VLLDSQAAHERLVKRVIGLPGDRVSMANNVLILNDKPARYSATVRSGIHDDLQSSAHYEIERHGDMRHAIRLSLNQPSPASSFGPVTIPRGQYLLLGDDRDNSMDSRCFGYFPRNEILGRARHVVLSLDPAHYYLPRPDRFGATLDQALDRPTIRRY